jgi:hypothetical protein
MFFSLLFGEGGILVSIKSPHSTEWTSLSHYHVQHSDTLRYEQIYVLIGQDSAYVLWLEMLFINGGLLPRS